MAPLPKRRRLDHPTQVAEITFDPSAREEYLTGFHKRKLARRENARETALKREREERVVQRRQMRDQRKQDLERHMAEFNAELRKQNPDLSSETGSEVQDGGAEEWVGIVEGKPAVGEELEEQGDAEYVDEDKYTTVTVEAMGESDEDEDEGRAKANGGDTATSNQLPPGRAKGKPGDGKPKQKKKHKFRYESKSERQETRRKQKTKSRAAKARREGK